MKAIRKSDGQEIEVVLLHEKEYIDLNKDESGGRCIYQPEALVLEEPTDWEAYRRDVAKEVLAGIATNIQIYIGEKDRCKAAAHDAIAMADELVNQLKSRYGKR